MTPLRGVVLGRGRVRLASGLVIKVPRSTGVKPYDTVIVQWDYIRRKAVSMEVWRPNAESEENSEQLESLHEIGDEPDEEVFLDSGSGALCPSSDDSGDSGFWELVLSDGSLAAAGVM